jgi:hypothetical protein
MPLMEEEDEEEVVCCKLTRMYRNFSSLVDLTSVLCTKEKKPKRLYFPSSSSQKGLRGRCG